MWIWPEKNADNFKGIIKDNNTNVNNEIIFQDQLVKNNKTTSNKFNRYYIDSVKEIVNFIPI